jgi:hypothetical protein
MPQRLERGNDLDADLLHGVDADRAMACWLLGHTGEVGLCHFLLDRHIDVTTVGCSQRSSIGSTERR